jgi:CRISPR-associated protein Csx1
MMDKGQPSTLLIFTWGLPARWIEVPYVFTPGEKTKFNYCTTLIPILHSIREAIEEGKVDLAIIVLDSLIDKFIGRPEKLDSKCFECYKKHSHYLDEVTDTYHEMTNKIKKFIEEFVKCLFMEYSLDIEIKPHVIVAPAVGSPGGKWIFKGELWDYQSKVLIELGEICLSKPYQRLMLDLSHGINYMPSLTLQLLPMISSILLLSHKELSSVKITVYNSDPVAQATTQTPLVINKDEVEVDSLFLVHGGFSSPSLSKWARQEAINYLQRKKRLEEYFSRVRQDAKYLYTSLYYPLPLALYYLSCRDNCRKLEETWSTIKSELESSIILIRDHDKNEILRPISVDPSTLYIYFVSRALCKRLGDHGLEPPSIIRLKEKEAEVYRFVHKALHRIVEHELSILMQLVKKLKGQVELYKYYKESWTSLCIIRKVLDMESEDCKKDIKAESIELRNLIAHTGLLKDLVEILVSDNDVRIKYNNIDVIKDLLEKLYSNLHT